MVVWIYLYCSDRRKPIGLIQQNQNKSVMISRPSRSRKPDLHLFTHQFFFKCQILPGILITSPQQYRKLQHCSRKAGTQHRLTTTKFHSTFSRTTRTNRMQLSYRSKTKGRGQACENFRPLVSFNQCESIRSCFVFAASSLSVKHRDCNIN